MLTSRSNPLYHLHSHCSSIEGKVGTENECPPRQLDRLLFELRLTSKAETYLK